MKDHDKQKEGTAVAVQSGDWLSALRYVANESQCNPNDSVRDMCNEAFDRYNIPMTAQWSGNDTRPIKFVSDNSQLNAEE